MSLNITIVAPWGIWQCSDHRLTDPRTGHPVDDMSVKHVGLHCPDGTGLLAYAGIGRVKEVYISDWVREVLRGPTRSLVQSIDYLSEQATESIGPIAAKGNYLHMFTIGAFLKEQPWLVQIKNFESRSHWDIGPPLSKFHTTGEQIKNESRVSVWGAPAASLEDFNRLWEIAKKRPRRPDDYHYLLAKTNVKAAIHPKYGSLISPACITSYLPPAGHPVESKTHAERPEQAAPLIIPAIFGGIDLTDMESLTMERLKTLKDDKPRGKPPYKRNSKKLLAGLLRQKTDCVEIDDEVSGLEPS